MQNFETQNNSVNSEYKSLRDSLFNGSVTLGEVLDMLLKLDQSSGTRDASDENLKFLLEPEIIEYVDTHPDFREEYHNLLSLTEFHVAQRMVSNNPAEAIKHFKKSLESAKFDQSDESWSAYVEATIMYMEGREIPEELIAKAEQSKNALILRNFNLGIKERGSPSYMEDYGNRHRK